MSFLGLITSDDQVHEYAGYPNRRRFVVAIIFQAFVDATYDGPQASLKEAKIEAHNWIVRKCWDFRHYCSLLGWNADAISAAYIAGQVDRELLKRNDRIEEAPDNGLTPVAPGKFNETILGAMTADDMRARDITEAIQAQGLWITSGQVSDALRGTLSRTGRVIGRKHRNLVFWSKEPGQ